MSYFKQKHDITGLPPKIRCDVGKEWKAPEHFSKNKLQTFANGKRRAPNKVTAASSGIACRVHSGEPETMMKCEGPCGKTYGLDHFSRNTRSRGVYWCMACTDWQLKNEPGFMPYPAPYAPRGADFMEGNAAAHDELVDKPGTIVDDDVSFITPSFAPSFASSFATSGTITSEHAHTDTLSAGFGGPTGSSAGPSVEGSVCSDSTYQGDAPANNRPKQFNAWGPDGAYHRATKAPTIVSEVTTATTSRKTVEVGRSGWVKPGLRKTPADAPDYIKFGHCLPTPNDDYRSDDGLSDDEI